MYLLTEEPTSRPTLVDDRNFYRPAGVRRWIKSPEKLAAGEFGLNPRVKIPLGRLGTMRTEFEAYLLLQNAMLCLQAMGLGGWIHASIAPPYLLGDPFASPATQGILNVKWHVPGRPFIKRFTVDLLRWATPISKMRANPCGLLRSGADPANPNAEDWLIKCLCSPNYSPEQAVDAVVQEKQQVYSDRSVFQKLFVAQNEKAYMDEVPHYDERVIECTKDICRYLLETHGRFPAHVDSLFVPGVWLQAHHLDLSYYDDLFATGYGYTPTHRGHQSAWH